MNRQEQIAHIERRQDETRAFVSEQHALLERDAGTVWKFPIAGMIVGATLFGGAAFVKLLGT